MNEVNRNLISSKVDALKASGIEMIAWEQAIKLPEFREYGSNRGLRLTFDKGDVLHFTKLKDAVFFTTSFNSNGKTYKVLKTLAVIEGSKGTWCREVPAAIFCRIPSLLAEQDILWENNSLGYQLATAQADYLRLELLCNAGDVKVTWVSGQDGQPNMHTDRWYTDKETGERVCVKDDPELPEKERIPLRCFKFEAIKKK